jgi:DNA/RNA-binding domain of Phe-tRNA-synthetase-like protein
MRDGAPPTLNAIVDLYNAVSLRFALPIGGEDASLYRGSPALARAPGGELFDTIQNGAPRTEPVEPSEVIWRDAQGATCRRWNWRQGVRTRIAEQSTDLWFVLERLDPMPLEALDAAGDMMIAGLQRPSPGLTVTRARLGPS